MTNTENNSKKIKIILKIIKNKKNLTNKKSDKKLKTIN